MSRWGGFFFTFDGQLSALVITLLILPGSYMLDLFNHPQRSLAPAMLLGILAACSPIGKPSARTQIEVPQAWKASTEGSSKKISRGWVKDLNDSRLPRLVNEAMTKNPSILATAERLKAARAGVIRARANRIPSASASAGGSRTRSNRDAAGGITSYSGGKNISVGASWELDLWGRLRHLHTAAKADYDSTVADLRGARLSLAANTASTWYNLISSENQVKLARETLASYQQVEKIIVRNYKAGTARSLELQLSRNNRRRPPFVTRRLHSRERRVMVPVDAQARQISRRYLVQWAQAVA